MNSMRSAPWPNRLDRTTALTAYVVEASGREFWFRLRREAETYRWQVANEGTDQWSIRDMGEPQATVADAVGVNRILLAIGRGRALTIRTQSEYERITMLSLVSKHVTAEDGEGWPDAVAAQWDDLDDELPLEIDHLPVWVSINGFRMVLLSPRAGIFHPVLFDRDGGTFTGLPIVAETSWFSESGGAPISWDGGSRLSQLMPGLLWSEAWGDTRQEASPVRVHGSEHLGMLVADFLLADGLQFFAAWLIEPFDIEATLDAQQLAQWRDLVSNIDVDVTVNLEPGEQLPACRAQLRTNPSYLAFSKALARPASASGRRLRSRLEEVRQTGVLGGILGQCP